MGNSSKHQKQDAISVSIGNLNEDIPPQKFTISKKETAIVLFNKYCDDLTTIYHLDQGSEQVQCKNTEKIMQSEKNYFGLRYSDSEGKLHWLENEKSVYKQLMSAGTRQSTLENSSIMQYKITFRMKHYPSKLTDLCCTLSQYLFYMQIRRDLIQGRLICPKIEDNIAIGSLVYQAEEGDAPFSDNAQLQQYIESNPNASKKKIFLSSNEALERKVMLAYMALSGKMTRSTAVNTLLNFAIGLPTYGIDPFQVYPRFSVTHNSTKTSNAEEMVLNTSGEVQNGGKVKRSMTLPNGLRSVKEKSGTGTSTSFTLPRETEGRRPNYYLGLSVSALQLFVGTELNKSWPWQNITHMKYSKNIFKIYCFEDDELTKKTKENKYTFQMLSPSSALGIWRWAYDRKCFFTLPAAKEAKLVKSSNSFLKRSKSFKFTGSSQAEIKKSVDPGMTDKQMQIMYTSMRVVGGLDHCKFDPNGVPKTAKASVSSRPPLMIEGSESGDKPSVDRSEQPATETRLSPTATPEPKTVEHATIERNVSQHSTVTISEETPVEELVTAASAQTVKATPNGDLNHEVNDELLTKNKEEKVSTREPPQVIAEINKRGKFSTILILGLIGVVTAMAFFVLEARKAPHKNASSLYQLAHKLRQLPAINAIGESLYDPLRDSFSKVAPPKSPRN